MLASALGDGELGGNVLSVGVGDCFVGADYMSSEIWACHLVPTQTSWDQADGREILCCLEATEMVSSSRQGAGI